MYWLTKLISVIFLFFSLAANSSAKNSSGDSPFEELLNYQERALMNAFIDKKIFINGFRSPNIFTGYIPFRGNQNFKVEAKLLDRMIVCVERIPGAERQVCANDAVLNIAKSDDKHGGKRYLIFTVSYFKHDAKEQPEQLFYSYRYAKDVDGLFSAWDLDESTLEKDKEKIRSAFMQFIKDAERLANKVEGVHPQIPDTVPRIELLDLTNENDVYEAKVSFAGEPPIPALVKVLGVHYDKKTITFIDKSKTPSLYGNVYEYNKPFYGRTFDGGKKVFELCQWSLDNERKTCNQYLIKLSDYFKDSVDWENTMWGP